MHQPRRLNTALATVCLAVFAAEWSGAQDDEPVVPEFDTPDQGGRAVWSLYWENDGVFKLAGRSDRHYTNGVRVVVSSHTQWADDLANWLPLAPANDENLQTAAFYSMAQLIFTPDNIENPAARRPGDRGYAGWLYFSVGIERASETIADRIDLKLGVIGPSSLAGKAQANIHDYFDKNREPIGWDEQLSDRFAIDLDVNRRWKFNIDHDETDYLAIELIPEAGFTVGTVRTHLMAGATVRIGSPFLPGDFGAGRLDAPTTAVGYPRGGGGVNENLAWSLYARAEGRAVLRNELLNGVEEEPFFGMVQVGVSLQIVQSLTIGYSQTWYTKEFRTQAVNDSIGAITIGWSYAY